MNREHFEAVKGRLEEDSALDGRVYETARLNPDGSLVRDTYVVLYGGSPAELGGDRLYRSQVNADNAVFDFTVRSVAPTVAGVFAVSQKVHTQLVGWTPDIEGRRCKPMRFTGADSIKADNSVKPPLYFIDDEFELRSNFIREGS